MHAGFLLFGPTQSCLAWRERGTRPSFASQQRPLVEADTSKFVSGPCCMPLPQSPQGIRTPVYQTTTPRSNTHVELGSNLRARCWDRKADRLVMRRHAIATWDCPDDMDGTPMYAVGHRHVYNTDRSYSSGKPWRLSHLASTKRRAVTLEVVAWTQCMIWLS